MNEKLEKEFEEYKKFAFNRNMMGVAIGLILATAFQKAVNGISEFLFMPIVNYFVGSADGDWRNMVVHPVPGMNIEFGRLLGTMMDFVILSFVLYFIWSRMMKKIWPEIEIVTDKKLDTPPKTP